MSNEADKIAIAVLPAIYTEFFAGCREAGRGPEDEHWRTGIVKDAYALADAVLAEQRERAKTVALHAAAPTLLYMLKKAVARQGFSNEELIDARAEIKRIEGGE